jgi:hypothetical protein
MTPIADLANSTPAKAVRQRVRSPQAMPVLEQLAAWYPRLFGAAFLPLKRGIFQDIVRAHPEKFEEAALKAALALHTRSTRYLVAVADGQQRHDLAGNPVESMAPEHVHHALLEVHRRRQARSKDDLTPVLRRRLVQAFERSGLAPDDYAALVRGRDALANALLDEALQEAREAEAKDEALLRAFESGARSVQEFAAMYGLKDSRVAQALARARRVRARAAQ